MPKWDVELYHPARLVDVTIRIDADSQADAETAATARAMGFDLVSSRPATSEGLQ